MFPVFNKKWIISIEIHVNLKSLNETYQWRWLRATISQLHKRADGGECVQSPD